MKERMRNAMGLSEGEGGLPYEALVKHFERAQRLSNSGSWEWDIGSNIIVWSTQIYAIFGLSPDGFTPTYPAFLERVHPDDRAAVEAGVQRALEGVEDYALDHRIVRPDGEVRVVREQAEIERDADGRPVRMIGAVLDVTSIRATEAAARHSEELLATMLRISPEAIIVADAATRILAFSAGAEAIFGYRAEEVIGERVEILLPTRFRREHRDRVEGFARGEAPSLRMHDRTAIAGWRKSGEEFPAEASLARLETQNGYAFTVIVRDVSEQRMAEGRLIEAREQAERANLAKSTFLANMSHEIRTPLNGVLGVAGALARTDLAPKQRDMLRLIESSGRALEGLLGDILDLAKVDAGHVSLRSEPLELGGLAREAVELFRASAAEKGVALEIDLDEAAAGVFRGDELKIRQVLSNLLSNAVKFTPQGEVRLAVSATRLKDGMERVRFVVRDTGIGFDPALAETLFERFEQADGSITREYGGTGLGLAISKSLAQLMGGSISATSAPGRGATFRFELPLERVADVAGQAEEATAPEAADVGGVMRVLLAEDHPVNRLTVQLILENLPVELTSVENGAEAVEAFMGSPFDLVLMDMQMPVMDGLAATRRMRALEAEAGAGRTPICMLTANAMADHRLAAEEAGADAFLTKPINAEGLITYVLGVAQQDGPADCAA
ncbi:MAG: PAS domain S-box protein [Pseudomonadota bacterium]